MKWPCHKNEKLMQEGPHLFWVTSDPGQTEPPLNSIHFTSVLIRLELNFLSESMHSISIIKNQYGRKFKKMLDYLMQLESPVKYHEVVSVWAVLHKVPLYRWNHYYSQTFLKTSQAGTQILILCMHYAWWNLLKIWNKYLIYLFIQVTHLDYRLNLCNCIQVGR